MNGGCPFGWRSALFVLALLPVAPSFAAHPLITEDTGTQGRGNGQLELSVELGHDETTDAEEDAADVAAVLAYGLLDNLDLMLTLPYVRTEVRTNGSTTRDDGLGDVGLDAKWRFFESGRLSAAMKAGVTLATGDESKGLGAGKANASLNFVVSYETESWGGHLHLGHHCNRNVHDERDAVRHVSVALTRTVAERLKLVADLGRFTTTDRAFDEDTSFLTLGAIYAMRDDFDIDVGVKHGLTDAETDTTLLLGVAFRF